MKTLILPLAVLWAGVNVSLGAPHAVEVKIGEELSALEGRIPGSRMKEVTLMRDVEIPEGIFTKSYRVNDTCYLEVCVSKAAKKIVAMDFLVYPAGAGNTPKMYQTILHIVSCKIDEKGAFSITSRP